jgi:hypothetical protein
LFRLSFNPIPNRVERSAVDLDNAAISLDDNAKIGILKGKRMIQQLVLDFVVEDDDESEDEHEGD